MPRKTADPEAQAAAKEAARRITLSPELSAEIDATCAAINHPREDLIQMLREAIDQQFGGQLAKMMLAHLTKKLAAPSQVVPANPAPEEDRA
jgi:hypothetical protein